MPMVPETHILKIALAAFLASALLAGCGGASDDTDAPSNSDVSGDAAFQELYDQGMDRYVGQFQPATTEDMGRGVTMHAFAGEDGPLCYTGEGYHMSTRDGANEALMVFLQGGGACGPNGCESIESWPPGIPGPLQMMGIMNAGDATNPAAEFDLAYLPYCDGSLWSGDREVDDDGDGSIDYHFRGLMNLTASVDVIAQTYPSPSRILLVGNSAGGFGVHHALPLLRVYYPEVPIDMVNDSGVGIAAPGGQVSLNDYWGAWVAYPESCADCIGADGNLTGFHSYQLVQDPNLRLGMMSYKQDGVILERSPMTPEAWEAELLASVDELERAHPDRFRSFIADGDGHTFVIRDYDLEVGGTTARAWIGEMLDSGAWGSASD
jgi:hypothetical protein